MVCYVGFMIMTVGSSTRMESFLVPEKDPLAQSVDFQIRFEKADGDNTGGYTEDDKYIYDELEKYKSCCVEEAKVDQLPEDCEIVRWYWYRRMI